MSDHSAFVGTVAKATRIVRMASRLASKVLDAKPMLDGGVRRARSLGAPAKRLRVLFLRQELLAQDVAALQEAVDADASAIQANLAEIDECSDEVASETNVVVNRLLLCAAAVDCYQRLLEGVDKRAGALVDLRQALSTLQRHFGADDAQAIVVAACVREIDAAGLHVRRTLEAELIVFLFETLRLMAPGKEYALDWVSGLVRDLSPRRLTSQAKKQISPQDPAARQFVRACLARTARSGAVDDYRARAARRAMDYIADVRPSSARATLTH